MSVLYGIKNCDTVKKARRWLEQHAVAYHFHDFRVDGIDEQRLASWTKRVGWETLLNRRGTSWRNLPETQRRRIIDSASAVTAMLAQPTLIKRPVLEFNGTLHVGFTTNDYTAFLN